MNKIKILAFTAASIISILGLCPASYAATYYVDASAASDSGSGSQASPKKYIKSGIALMTGGDTLIIKDGVYTGDNNMLSSASGWEYNNIPDGTPGAYTTIRAENYLGAVIDGENARIPMYINQNSYVKFENIHFRNSGILTIGTNVIIAYSDHIKVLKCASEETYNWHFRLQYSNYVLFEDCFTWGRGAYAFVAKGASDDFTQSSHNVYRRCVARRDAHYFAPGGNNHGSFVAYYSDHNYYQNCVSIDHHYIYAGQGSDPGFVIASYYIANGGSNYNVQSSLSINEENNGMMFEAGPNNVNINNSAFLMSASGSNRGMIFRDTATTNIANSILAYAGVDALYESGNSVLQSCKNNLIFGNSVGFQDVSGTHTYNILYNNGANYVASSAGTGERTNINPLTNGLKYPVRIEAGSALAAAGEGGARSGPEILKKIGISGTLYGEAGWDTVTSENLWPFPNEDVIKQKMSAYNLHGANGARGFCAPGTTLTKYIWEFLGNTIPPEIYGATANTPPVLASIGNKSVNENIALSFALSASDADGDSLTYSAAGLPAGATLSGQTFSWTPNSTQSGSYTVTFTVNDGNGGSDSEAITITVVNVNAAPVLTAIGNKSIAENAALTFTISATDADGDTLTYSASNLPAGATFNASTKTFSWTPGYAQAGTYSAVHFQVTDGSLSASEDITITVNNANQAPALSAIGNKTVAENIALSFALSASDADGDTLTYSASSLPTGATLNSSSGAFNWTPTYAQAGSYSITLSANDGKGGTASEAITITVTNVNRAPVLTATGNKSVAENSALSFTINATDADGDTLAYSANALPAGAALNSSSGAFNWTPTYAQAGSYPITFSVSDGKGGSASEAITITVANVNRAPVLTAIGNQIVTENSTLTFTISATDADGDTLTYSASNLPTGATFNASTKTFSWTPGYAQAGIYSAARFAVTDGSLSASEDITITVNNNNRLPALTSIGNKTVAENTALTFTISATDADGDALTYSASGLPTGAAFNAATRAFSWTPDYAQAGSYSVTFSANDGKGGTASETIAITVTNVSRAPVLAAIGNKTVKRNQLLTFTLSASDADGDTLTYTAAKLPAGAVFSGQTFSWTPNSSQSGTYSGVHFEVSDGALTDSEDITITVAANTPPGLNKVGNKNTAESQALSFQVSATDADGDALAYSAAGLPSGAAFAGQNFSWTPTYTQAGSYDITFSVNDGNGGTASDISKIIVTNTNRPPVLAPIGNKSTDASSPLSFGISASDADGDALVFSAANLPLGASLNSSTGAFQWTPSAQDKGSFPVTFSVTDTNNASDSEAIAILVGEKDATPPVVSNLFPVNDDFQVPLDTNIFFHIKDSEKGVDISSISLSVKREADAQAADIILNGQNQLSAFPGNVAIRGTPADYIVFYDPPNSQEYKFGFEERVSISINARDLAGNKMNAYTASFTTIMMLKGPDLKLNSPQPAAVGLSSAPISRDYSRVLMDSANTIYAFWQTADGQLWMAKSTDLGITFAKDVMVGDSLKGTHANLSVAMDQPGNIYALWENQIGGSSQLYFGRMPKGASSFESGPIPISQHLGQFSSQAQPSLDVSQNGDIHICWVNLKDNAGVYYATSGSNNKGEGLWNITSGQIIRIDDRAAASFESPSLKVGNNNQNKYICWSALKNNIRGIYFNKLDNKNIRGYPADIQINDASGSAIARNPRFALSPQSTGNNDEIYAVWENENASDNNIFFSKSLNSGASWSKDTQVNEDAQPPQPQKEPNIAVDRDGRVY
ncbi:tandem-95 repeat protein, partial [bacterium]